MTIDDARENFMSDVYNTLDFLPTNNEANRIIDSFDRVTSGLNQQPCEDCVSRQAVNEGFKKYANGSFAYGCVWDYINKLPSAAPKEKTGHCKDCKWWKDNDGVYRRGVGAESKCPINRKEVYEGNGYCFLFEPQESEG